jgi:hypothetical protein
MHEKHHKQLNQPKYMNYPINNPYMHPCPTYPTYTAYPPYEPYTNPLYEDYMKAQEELNMLKEHVKILNSPKKIEIKPEKQQVKQNVPKFNVLKHLLDTVEDIGIRGLNAVKTEINTVSEKYKTDYYNDIYKSKNTLQDSKNSAFYKTLINDTTINGYNIDELTLTKK